MRNSGNTAYSETVASGMVNPGSTVQDSGAVFNVGGDGKTIVQTLPNGGKVDAELAAFIVANTGGANSPYGWSGGQTGKGGAVAVNPNAGLNTVTPNANGCVTAECAASLGAGTPTVPNGSYGVGYYPGLMPGGEVEIEVQGGSIVGGKVGAGWGVGGHLNLGTQSVGGGLLKGPVFGAKAPAPGETNPQQAGEVRVGPAISGTAGVGSVGVEGGFSGGQSITSDRTTPYVNFTLTPVASPTVPKISIEAKINIIEFSVKPPAQPSTPIPEGGSK